MVQCRGRFFQSGGLPFRPSGKIRGGALNVVCFTPKLDGGRVDPRQGVAQCLDGNVEIPLSTLHLRQNSLADALGKIALGQELQRSAQDVHRSSIIFQFLCLLAVEVRSLGLRHRSDLVKKFLTWDEAD